MSDEDMDTLIRQACDYDWREDNGRYFVGYVGGEGLDVTKRIMKAKKRLFDAIKKDPQRGSLSFRANPEEKGVKRRVTTKKPLHYLL